MKTLIKSLLTIAVVSVATVQATGAYFTSTVSAENNQIEAGTLRLAIDSTQVHTNAADTWGFPIAYTVVEDVDGLSTQYNTLETWLNAAPGPYAGYTNEAGADSWADGNYSYWVAFRNNSTISMKVSGDVDSGSWTIDPAVQAATLACQTADLNATPTVAARNVHFYAADNCEGHEECENIYYGLKTGPWNYANTFSNGVALYAVDVAGAPLTGEVYASHTGTNAGVPMQLDPQEFVIARIDVNFDNAAAVGIENCYQGATFEYDLNGYAHQLGDMSW
jgi:predicted ribosomally synthesized peptide with SipW-like signal peptide